MKSTMHNKLLFTISALAITVVTSKPMDPVTPKEEVMTLIDHAFLMDCTGSMGSYIQTAKDKILDLVMDLSEEYPNLALRLAFIGYRDITDWGPEEDQFISIQFTQDHNKFRTDLLRVNADGGGDLAEDVYSGLLAAVELDWKADIRMMTLLSDAPHNEGAGRKKYDDMKPLLEKLAHKAGDQPFYFNFFKIGRSTRDLGERISAMIPENMKFEEHELDVGDGFAPRDLPYRRLEKPETFEIPYRRLAPPMLGPKWHSETAMDSAGADYGYGSASSAGRYRPYDEYSRSARPVATRTVSSYMDARAKPDSKSTYLDTLKSIMATAIDNSMDR